MKKYRIAIVGAGKVGTTMAIVLKKAGYEISGVYSRSLASAECLAQKVAAQVMETPLQVAAGADVILLTVPDREIAMMAQRFAENGDFHEGQFVFHLCGSQSAESLACIRKAKAKIGSLHPLQSFADVESAVKVIAGTYFAIDGDAEAMALAKMMIADIGGIPFAVDGDKRALYHAAACMASNYTVALLHGALQMMEKLGMDEQSALQALEPILLATFQNIKTVGTVQALTGPIVRGDAITITKHRQKIAELSADELQLYDALGIYTTKLAEKRGTLTKEQVAMLARELQKG